MERRGKQDRTWEAIPKSSLVTEQHHYEYLIAVKSDKRGDSGQRSPRLSLCDFFRSADASIIRIDEKALCLYDQKCMNGI